MSRYGYQPRRDGDYGRFREESAANDERTNRQVRWGHPLAPKPTPPLVKLKPKPEATK